MSHVLITEEQKHLDEVVKQIEHSIENLRSERRKPVEISSLEHHEEERIRQKRINEYEKIIDAPYKGKIEIRSEDGAGVETFLIGTKGVSLDGVTELIVDWRTPFGSIFNSFHSGNGEITVKSPGGVVKATVLRKRITTIQKRMIHHVHEMRSTQFTNNSNETSTEVMVGAAGSIDRDTTPEFHDELLGQLWSNQNDDYQLREIIATIQQEQNEIIRLGISNPVLVQGVAGSGKTSIALHRISYLLYAYREQLKADNILILAPNRMFIQYMQGILPELDIEQIQQSTVEDMAKLWVKNLRNVRMPQDRLNDVMQSLESAPFTSALIRYKGSLAYKSAIDRYIDQLLASGLSVKGFVLPTYSGDPIAADERIQSIFEGYKYLPVQERYRETIKSVKSWMELEFKKQKKMIENRVITTYNEWTKGLLDGDERAQLFAETINELAAFQEKKLSDQWNEEFKKWSSQFQLPSPLEIFKQLHHTDLITALDPNFPVELLDDWTSSYPQLEKGQANIEDLAALIHIEHRMNGLPQTYDYLVIDEAQDLSPFMIAVLKPLTRSMTVLGDITQSVFGFCGVEQWEEWVDPLFGDTMSRLNLTISYRSTYEIMTFANDIIQNARLPYPTIQPFRRHGEKPIVTEVKNGAELVQHLKQAIERMKSKGLNKIAVISKDMKLSDALYRQMAQLGLDHLQKVENVNDALQGNVIFIPATLVKGLEFDAVIIPNANARTYKQSSLDAKLLFVSVTRAQEAIEIFYFEEPSPLLKGLIVKPQPNEQSELDALLNP